MLNPYMTFLDSPGYIDKCVSSLVGTGYLESFMQTILMCKDNKISYNAIRLVLEDCLDDKQFYLDEPDEEGLKLNPDIAVKYALIQDCYSEFMNHYVKYLDGLTTKQGVIDSRQL